jgi:hypothetical protein
LSRCLVYGAFADPVRVACHSTAPEGLTSIDLSNPRGVKVRTDICCTFVLYSWCCLIPRVIVLCFDYKNLHNVADACSVTMYITVAARCVHTLDSWYEIWLMIYTSLIHHVFSSTFSIIAIDSFWILLNLFPSILFI